MSGAWSNDQLNSLFIYDTNGNLILTVTENGIVYIAPNRRFDLNSAGFKVQSEPADGGYIQLTTQGAFGAVMFLQIATSAVVGATFSPAILFVDEVLLSATDTQPVTNLYSPAVNGKDTAQILLRGESSAGTDNREVELIGDQFLSNGIAVGTGWYHGGQATGNFGPIGNTETIFIPAAQRTYKAGHAYQVVVWGQATVSAAPNRPVWRIRQSSDGTANLGTQVCLSSKPHVTTAMHDACWSGVFGVGASDVTTYMCLTMTSASAAFTVTALNSPFQFDIYDIGDAADHPGIINIT